MLRDVGLDAGLAGLQAGRADVLALAVARGDLDANGLDVRIPPAVGTTV